MPPLLRRPCLAACLAAFLLAPTPSQAQLSTDSRELPRSYRSQAPLIPVLGGLFPAEETPWEVLDSHSRRKVFFDERITFVILEVVRKGPAPAVGEVIPTHYHPHDQISYVLDGKIRAQVAGEIRELGSGSTYVVPSNVHHGIQVLSEKLTLLDMFTPTREDFRPPREVGSVPGARWTTGEMEIFVRNWFRGFDENVPAQHFLDRLVDEGLEMRFPEATLNSHADFQGWYAAILETIARASHGIRSLEIVARDATTYDVDLVVLWTATTVSGEELQFLARQVWEIRDTGETQPRIARYLVEAAPGDH